MKFSFLSRVYWFEKKESGTMHHITLGARKLPENKEAL